MEKRSRGLEHTITNRRWTIFFAILLSASTQAFAKEQPALPHFYQVTPSIYRGAQPRPEQFAALAKMGVRTVINLRSTEAHIENERRIVEALGMRYVSIPLRGYHTPPDTLILRALRGMDVADQTRRPVFVHCRLGKDRTGTVIACYRIARQGWKNEQALREAREIGMSWRQKKMESYILNFSAANINSHDTLHAR